MSGKRIFWLGMHKILVQTELARLRELGYEVFNPPYLSNVKDQSACLQWDAEQPTTLPADVFKKLSRYNFFYNSISQQIAELLNAYFDTVIVTISPAWLKEILVCYKGRVIYRTYGQHYLLSQELESNRLIHNIISRDNFWFLPHAVEAVQEEDSWLRERELIVPYCLTKDIFAYKDTWHEGSKQPEIALTCPNIQNPYFKAHYDFLRANFDEPYYKYYGVQLSNINNPQVMGTLPRDEQISRLQKSAGFLYTHTEGRVCYLPPIEMMVLGGPVLYLKGSLLDRYFNEDSPGRCFSVDMAHVQAKRLLQGDRVLIDEIIASQNEVRQRYMPEIVWPQFDSAMQNVLNEKNYASSWLAVKKNNLIQQLKRIYIFHHFPGMPIVMRNGSYAAFDGIPRVVRQIVNILSEIPDAEIFITAYAHQVPSMNGYFRNKQGMEKIRILCINPTDLILEDEEGSMGWRLVRRIWSRGKRISKSIIKKLMPFSYRYKLRSLQKEVLGYIRYLRTYVDNFFSRESWYIKLINDDKNCSAVFVPHYYLFPEAVMLTKKMVLYLPDYMPHFFHSTHEFETDEGTHTHIGQRLVKKADKVFCNSNFTKDYLPSSRLQVPAEKIHVSYLPFLNSMQQNDVSSVMNEEIFSKSYIFYPTRPHPNKNLSFLLRILNRLVEEGHDINLVLTTTLECDKKAVKVMRSIKNKNRVICLDVVTDEMLAALYKNAAALCFTSLAEGNFPPQIYEALKYDTPIVAGNLGFITERVPCNLSDSLVLCEPNDEDDFVAGCKFVINNRELAINKQRQLLQAMEMDNVNGRFRNKVLEIFNLR